MRKVMSKKQLKPEEPPKAGSQVIGGHQVVKMNNPHIEVVPDKVTQISNVKDV